MADFFTGEEFYEKGEDARLELSPDDVRCMNEVIKACSNAISRNEVLDMMQMRMSGKELYKAVYELPPVTPKQTTWIPCSERLPEESGYYLVSVIDGSGEDDDSEAVETAWFAHKKDYDIKESEWRQLGIDETVIAWMPKPAPFKAESEG